MSQLALPSATQLAQLNPFEQAVLGYLARCKSEKTMRAYREDLRRDAPPRWVMNPTITLVKPSSRGSS